MKKVLPLILLLISLSLAKNICAAPRIADIKFSGIYPFFSGEITNFLTIRPGDDLDSVQISSQSELIRAFYQKKGFRQCSVSVNFKNSNTQDCIVNFKVAKGDYDNLDKVSVSGNNNFWDFRLLKECKLFWNSLIPGPDGRFSTEELQNDLKKLDLFYRTKGYYDVKIEDQVSRDSSNNTKVNFKITEGNCYQVKFNGNDFFWDYELNDLLESSTTNGRSGEEILRRTKRQIISRYKRAGFNNIKTDYRVLPPDSSDNNTKTVIYTIIEETRPLIKDVIFRGNNSLSSSDLKPYLKSVYSDDWSFKKRFNDKFIDTDISSLLELYRQQGFLKCNILLQTEYSAQKDSVILLFQVSENQRTIINSINFDSVAQLSELKKEKFILQTAGKPFLHSKIEEELQNYKNSLVAAGYLNAKAVVDYYFTKDSCSVDLDYKINSGKLILTGSVVVAGNLVTDESVIINQLSLENGKPMLAEKISDGLKNLRDQSVYRSVIFQSDENTLQDNKRDIRVKVEENPPYYLESSAGYESSSGALFSFLFGSRNLAGRNLDLNFKGLYSETVRSAEINLTEPLLFSIPLAMNLQSNIREESAFNSGFTSLIFGSGLGFKYKWDKNQTSYCSGSLENRQMDSLNSGYSISETSRYLVNISAGHLLDTRNSFVRPTEGWFAQLGINGFGGITSLKDNLVKYNLDIRNYYNLFKNIVFATKLSCGFIQEYEGGKQPMADQLYFLGGVTSVRGISENLFLKDSSGVAIGGKTAIATNFEIRPKIYSDFEIPIFSDMGFLVYKQSVHHHKFRITAGSGLRYVTAFGAVGFLYGFPLAETSGFQNGCFHLSVGYSF